MCTTGFQTGGIFLWTRVSPQRMRNTPPHHSTSWHSPYSVKPSKAELRMLEKVTVTDAMADDMEKLRPRLKKVHIRELALNITTMLMTHNPTWTCRRKRHCGHPHRTPVQTPAASEPPVRGSHNCSRTT